MISKQELIEKLQELEKQDQGTYVVKLFGKTLQMYSGKSSWSTAGDAKRALKHCLYTMGGSYNSLKTREWTKQLEDEGSLTYEKV